MPSIFEILLSKILGNDKEEEEHFQKRIPHTIDRIEDKKCAYYSGADVINSTIYEDITKAGASLVRFDRETKHSGATILEESPKLALTKAGTILLDAFDHGAEVLIVENEEDFEMFTKNLTKIESIMGREITMEILLAFDFLESDQTAAA